MEAAALQRASTAQFPGFDGLRLGAAVAVLLCHAFVLAEALRHGSGWQHFRFFGDYGVYTFFIISGFLLHRSLSLNLNLVQFSINRILRIAPGFLFCISMTAFVFGPIVSDLKITDYFFQVVTYDYLIESVLCLCDSWQMPFAFTSDPNFMYTKNASLWTLRYEVASYLFLLLVWTAFRDQKFVVMFAAAVVITCLLVPDAHEMTFHL